MILALRRWTYWVRNKIGRSERILPAELIFRFISIRRWYATVKDIFECFDFHTQVDRLSKAGLLYLVSEKFANIDLHPEVVSNRKLAHRRGKLQLIDASGMWLTIYAGTALISAPRIRKRIK